MALTPQQRARLDAYLASFTPDITTQMDDLRTVADDLDALHKQYDAGLSAVGTARDRLQAAAAAARHNVSDALDPDVDDEVSREDLIDALVNILEAVDTHTHDVDEIFMDELPCQDYNGFFPLEVYRDVIVTTAGELAEAARALDEHAGRIGRIA